MTAEYIIRTLFILFILFFSCYFSVRIRRLVSWIKTDNFFYSPDVGMRQIPCEVLSSLRRYATFILLAIGLVCILEYGWIVYRYVSPPTPTEYFAYEILSSKPK